MGAEYLVCGSPTQYASLRSLRLAQCTRRGRVEQRGISYDRNIAIKVRVASSTVPLMKDSVVYAHDDGGVPWNPGLTCDERRD